MTIVTGELMIGSDRQHLRALADHLRRHEQVIVRVFDAAGRMVLDPGGTDEVCPQDDHCRTFIRESCAACEETDAARCLTCPRGRGVRVLPIKRSQVFFGTLIACSTDDEGAQIDKSTGAVLDAMHDILTEESSKEHEINSLASELAVRYEEIKLLYAIDEHIPLRSYTNRVMEFVAEKSFSVLNCSCLAWVALGAGASHDSALADCRVVWNSDHPEPASTMLRLEAEQLSRAIAERCLRTAEGGAICNLDDDHELSAFASELNSVLYMPLTVETDLYGCVVAFKPRGDQFTSYESQLMGALARKSAFVIRDSRLYEDLDALFFNLIKLLVNTIENKDEYTKGHSQRVRAFTVRLAELMGLSKAEVETLNVSGLLHDIGKQGIPDAVLKKEGKLSDDERAMIQTHSVRGVNLIKHIKQFADCLPHIRHHHERIDGKGYPDGLAGTDIPLGARIIAVADTYDALTSDRCYRPRFTMDKAFQIIEEVTGTQLDKDVAKLLLDNREDFVRHSQAAEQAGPLGDLPRVRAAQTTD